MKITKFNRYEYDDTTDLLGKGGFGEVFKAWDVKRKQFVVLKFGINDLGEQYSIEKDYNRGASLSHSNICKYLDIEEETHTTPSGRAYVVNVLVMEYCNSGRLSDYFKNNPKLSKEAKIDLFVQVLQGLDYLHNNGFIHRDLDGSNVLLHKNESNRLEVKITDFGISKKHKDELKGSHSNISRPVGKDKYMAPEQLDREKYATDRIHIDKRVDLWSFGVMVYTSLTKQYFFELSKQSNSNEILRKLAETDFGKLAEGLEYPFNEVIKKCLVLHPSQRVGDADELIAILKSKKKPEPEPKPNPNPKNGKTDIIDIEKKERKLPLQKYVLILIVGLSLVAGVFFYREYERAEVVDQLIIAENYYESSNFDSAFLIYTKYNNHPLFSAKMQSNLGTMYFNGFGVDKDYSKAVEWYRKSAEQGDVNGQINLGTMYFNGFGVDKDYSKAVEWYRKSAEQGDVNGQINLGAMYLNGFGVDKDYSEAVKWFQKSADQGDASGQFHLAYMYSQGKGVFKSDSDAVEWLKKSAEQGNAEGEFFLGLMYSEGKGIYKDDSEAVKWYRKSAEKGYAIAQNALGLAYLLGKVVDKNYSEAVEWFRKSAEQGDADGQNNLGYMYFNGFGVDKDYSKAAEWYRKSAEQGNEYAQSKLKELSER